MPRSQSWLDAELAGSAFADERLGKRLRTLLEQMGEAVGESLPMACQDWAATKAAYRFLDNDRVSEAEILAGHSQATRARFLAHDGPVLVLQDTTEFLFKREGPAAAGFSARPDRRKAGGVAQVHTGCGLMMHASLVVTLEGLPLGLAAAKFWTRDKFIGTAALEKRDSPTRMPVEEKESERWLDSMRQSTALLGRATNCVHVCDREGDIYELFCTALELGTRFLVRTSADRRAGGGDHTVADEMAEEHVQGVHDVDGRDARGNPAVAVVEVKYRRVLVHPPVDRSTHHPPHRLTVIHAIERGARSARRINAPPA
ncbi:MAG: transposase, partial [Alphaproteobacteria bacterium]|nr:transposase [Alphaproteobacteria bacterium]